MKMSPPPLPWLITAFAIGAILAMSLRVKLALDQQSPPSVQTEKASTPEPFADHAMFMSFDIEARLRAAQGAQSIDEYSAAMRLLTDAEMLIASLPNNAATIQERDQIKQLVSDARASIESRSTSVDQIETAIAQNRQTLPFSPAVPKAIADQIEKAKNRFLEARASGDAQAYLIGYGHYKTAETLFIEHSEDIRLSNEKAAKLVDDSLALLAEVYVSPRLEDITRP